MTTALKQYLDGLQQQIPDSIADLPGVGALAAMNSISLAGSAITGTLPPSKLRTFSGDVASEGYVLTLMPTGVAPGDYTLASITVDAKGRIVAASSGSIPTAVATDYEITEATKGLILRSPGGARWRITIDDSGTLIRTAL